MGLSGSVRRIGVEPEYLGVVDQCEPSLRGDQFGDVGGMLLGMRRRKDESGSANAELGNLGREGSGMVDDMMCPEPLHPRLGVRPRGGGDDREVRALTGDLDGDRADAAGAANDEDRGGGTRNPFRHIQAIEHRLPCRQRRQRQRRRFCPVQRRGLFTDNPGVDEMELRVGAAPRDRSGVIDLVAGLELRHVRADLAHDPGGIPSKHLPITIRGR